MTTKPKTSQQAPIADASVDLTPRSDQAPYAVERERAAARGNVGGARTGRPNVPDDAVLRVPTANPKREGSRAHGRLAELIARYGGTDVRVGDALAETAYTRADVNWDLARGTVELVADEADDG